MSSSWGDCEVVLRYKYIPRSKSTSYSVPTRTRLRSFRLPSMLLREQLRCITNILGSIWPRRMELLTLSFTILLTSIIPYLYLITPLNKNHSKFYGLRITVHIYRLFYDFSLLLTYDITFVMRSNTNGLIRSKSNVM